MGRDHQAGVHGPSTSTACGSRSRPSAACPALAGRRRRHGTRTPCSSGTRRGGSRTSGSSFYDPELAAEETSRVTWEIEAQDGGFSKLTVIHDRLENAPKTAASVSGAGWMMVLSGLKSVLETGEGLS